MKAGEIAKFFMNMDPNAEIKVASAAEGDVLVEDLIVMKPGFNVVLLQTQSFMLELERRAFEAGIDPKPTGRHLKAIN